MSSETPTGWAPTAIGDFAWEVSERAAGDGDQEVLSCTKHDGFVPSLEYFDRQVFSKDTSRYKLVKRGQYAYATIHLDEGSIDCLEIRDRGIISPMYTVFDVDPDRVNRKFFLELLRTPEMLRRYSAIGQGSVNRRKSISFETLSKETVPLPPLPEQREIAAILSSVDEAIQATEAVIEQTRRVKEGLLQDLLTKGIGHTRFKQTEIGKIPNHWGLRTLRDVVDPTRKITYGIVQPGEYREDGVPLIRGQNYIGGWESVDKFFRVGRELHRKYRRSTTLPGDVLLCIVGATTGAAAEVPDHMPEANITQTTARIAAGSGTTSRFLLYYLQSELGQSEVRRLVKGSAQPGLNLKDVERFRLPLPPISEQEGITRRLSEVDTVIQTGTDNLKAISGVKAGLLQDLLTGNVRVAV